MNNNAIITIAGCKGTVFTSHPQAMGAGFVAIRPLF